MNTTDKNLLIGVTVAGIAGALYLRNKEKKGTPVSLFGLDAKNTKKFVLAVTILTGGILLYNQFGKATA